MLAGCASTAPLLTPDMAGQVETYRLSAGDRLRITTFNEPNLTGEFAVTGDGNLSFPLIGNVPVSGKSISEVQALLTSRLAGRYLNDPRITAEVTNYRPFYVLGEVGRPGQYPFAVGLSLPQAIAIAGGYSYRANQKVLFVKRGDNPAEQRVDVTKNTVYVRPGDVIRVGERYF
jgi:polysaccharide export outer membrane protein